MKVKRERQRLACSKMLRELTNEYYEEGNRAEEEGRPVCWISTMAPIEPLYAADVFPIYPENHSAACASRHLSEELIESCESQKYSGDLCSYATCCLGSIFAGKGTFGGRPMPKPDFLITTELCCNIHTSWWTWMSNYFKIPLFVLDAGYVMGSEPEQFHIDYFVSQLKEMVAFIENQTKKKITTDRLEETLDLSNQSAIWWSKISNSRKSIPSPLGPRDIFTLMFPTVTLSGTKKAVEFYKIAWDEIRERVDNRVAGVPDEKYRLIWDLFPLWHNLRLFGYLEDAGGVFVADLYGDSFSARVDPKDPFNGLVPKYFRNPSLQEGVQSKVKRFKKFVEEFHIDGVVLHSNRPCRYFSMGQLDVMHTLREELDIPCLLFESDHVDPRKYSDSSVKNMIESFLEVLESRRH